MGNDSDDLGAAAADPGLDRPVYVPQPMTDVALLVVACSFLAYFFVILGPGEETVNSTIFVPVFSVQSLDNIIVWEPHRHHV